MKYISKSICRITFTAEKTFKTIIVVDEHGNISKALLTQTACVIEYVMLH